MKEDFTWMWGILLFCSMIFSGIFFAILRPDIFLWFICFNISGFMIGCFFSYWYLRIKNP